MWEREWGVWGVLLGAWPPRGDWAEKGQQRVGALRAWGLAVLPSLVLVPLHTTPKAVEPELKALYEVFLDVSQRWQSEVRRGPLSGAGGGMARGPGPTAASLCRM